LGVEVVEAEAGEAALGERGGGGGVLVLREPGERVVVEVVGVLIDGPGDAGGLVELRGSFPFFGVAVEATGFATCGYLAR
jgi:hypothetical protein